MVSLSFRAVRFLLTPCRGHNELDLPGLTSPLMYEKIGARKSVPQLYEEKLLVRDLTHPGETSYSRLSAQSEEVITAADISRVRGDYKAHLDAELTKVTSANGSFTPAYPSLEERQWQGMVWPQSDAAEHDPVTGVEKEVLDMVGRASVKTPENFVSVRGVVTMRSGFIVLPCRRSTRSSRDTSRIA